MKFFYMFHAEGVKQNKAAIPLKISTIIFYMSRKKGIRTIFDKEDPFLRKNSKFWNFKKGRLGLNDFFKEFQKFSFFLSTLFDFQGYIACFDSKFLKVITHYIHFSKRKYKNLSRKKASLCISFPLKVSEIILSLKSNII